MLLGLLPQHLIDRHLVWNVDVPHHSPYNVRQLEVALLHAATERRRTTLNNIHHDHVHAPLVDGLQRPTQLNVILQLDCYVRTDERLQYR